MKKSHYFGSSVSPIISRCDFLQKSGLGFGSMALAYLMHTEELLSAGTSPGYDLTPKPPHFAPRARAVIQLMQNGGPGQMDIFDPKPDLQKRDGQSPSESVETFQTGSEANKLLASPFKFHPAGECGMELSEVVPYTASIADDICLIRSMYTEHANHTEALVMLQTCKIFPGRPSMGSWISYGLGTENQNLPSYVVLRDPEGYNTSGTLLWENGWLARSVPRYGIQFQGGAGPGSQSHSAHPGGSPPRSAVFPGQAQPETSREIPASIGVGGPHSQL